MLIPALEFKAEVGGHYSRELRPVSSTRIRAGLLNLLLMASAAAAISPQNPSPGAGAQPRNAAPVAPSGAAVDIAQLFQAGQDALNQARLDEAERDFRQVLAESAGGGRLCESGRRLHAAQAV